MKSVASAVALLLAAPLLLGRAPVKPAKPVLRLDPQYEWWNFQDSPFKPRTSEVTFSKYRVEQMKPNETIYLRKIGQNESTNRNPCYELKTSEFKSRRFCYPVA